MKKRPQIKTGSKRRRPLPTLPAVGKTFRKSNLPQISGKMYSRLSQIYGIPIKELTPVHTETTLFSTFSYPGHRVSIGVGGFRAIDHELLHSLQYLLKKGPRMETRRQIANTMPDGGKQSALAEFIDGLKLLTSKSHIVFRAFEEPSAGVGTTQVFQPLIQSFSSAKGVFISSFLLIFGLKALPLVAVFLSPEIYRGMITRHYYKKHGPEGLILLFADPPKHTDLLHLKSKEKEFVERGYLKERGGFTPKGIQYLRQIMPRGLILERLQDFKKYRRRKK